MTVKLLTPRGDYPAGALYTNTAATEAALVAAKEATTDLTGGISWPPPGQPQVVPVTATRDPATGVTTLQAGGEAVSVGERYGAGYEPTIGGVVTQRITVDEGSDANHAEIILTFNAGPSGDIAIASERLANADSRADVVKTGITGATADGAILPFSLPNGLTSLYIARKGGASYTQASGAVATASQAVAALWSGAIPLRYATVNIGSSYTGGGTNRRYRDIVVTGYLGV